MTGNVCDRLRSTLRLIVAVLLLISLASCYPEFKNPLPPPPAMKADQQILGTWHRTTKTEKEQLSIFQRRSGWIDAAYIEDIDGASKDGIRVAVFE